ncbi:MAG: ParB family protein [Pseudomonadota bacterium]
MKKPVPTREEIRGLLFEGNFRPNSHHIPLEPGDPITVTPMVVEIERVRPYDGNIRLVRNPRYDDIRHRILTLGQEGELPITRRPGAEHFMIAKGGNTRWEIMHGLWQAGDGRFRTVHCRYYPWTCESDVLAAHLAENEVRGENIFIEKALALQNLRLQWVREIGAPLSGREFERQLRESAGLSYHRRDISRFEYAAETLYPLIPEALCSGLGPRQTDQIKKLETTYRNYWLKRRGTKDEVAHRAPPDVQRDGPDDEPSTPEQGSAHDAAYAVLFGEALSRHDGPEMIIEEVRDTLEKEVAIALDLPLRTVRMDIDTILAGVEFDIAPAVTLMGAGLTAATDGPLPGMMGGTPGHAGAGSEASGGRPARAASAPVKKDTETVLPPAAEHPPAHAAASAVEQVFDEPRRGPSDLKSLRSRAYVLAWQLCQRHGMAGCLSATPHRGMGFVVDLPEQPLLPSDDHTTGSLRYWVWCSLFGVSGQIGNVRRVQSLPADSRLRALALGMNAEGHPGEVIKRAIFTRVANVPELWMHCDIHWQFLMDPFFVDDRDIKDVLLLVQACRDLRKQSGDDSGNSLWEDKS